VTCFYQPDVLAVTQLAMSKDTQTTDCQSVAWPHPFLIRHWTPEGREFAAFIRALCCTLTPHKDFVSVAEDDNWLSLVHLRTQCVCVCVCVCV